MAGGKIYKYKRRRRRKAKLPRQLLGNTFTTTLRYYEQGPINPLATGLAAWVFQANGLYDPNVTYTGHQPRGFDQLMPLYDHFVVMSSKCKVTLCAENPGDVPITCTLALRDSVTTSSDPINYIEGRHCAYTLLPPAETHTLHMNFNAKKFFGAKDPCGDDEQQGTVSADPVEGAYYHLGLNSPSGTDPGPIMVLWDITYTVKFIEPRQPAQS